MPFLTQHLVIFYKNIALKVFFKAFTKP